MAEQYVKLLAHWKGCEVFQNVGCTGATDIVLIHPELGSLQIDVKCDSYGDHAGRGYFYWKQCAGAQIKPPVYVARVTPDGDISNWKVRWPKGRVPEGWENFWSNDNRIYTASSTKPTNAN